MKLNLQKIELSDNYEETVGDDILEMLSGTDMYSYSKYVSNNSLKDIVDVKNNKKVWLAAERKTERYRKHVSEYNRTLWTIEEIEYEYIMYYYDKRFMEIDNCDGVNLSMQYHGLAAYSSAGATENLNFLINNEDIVICGSDRAIGRIGVIFNGIAHKASLSDIYSDKDEREASDRNLSVKEEVLYAMSEILIGKKQYIETFSTCKQILAIWCKEFKSEEEEKEVIGIANSIGVPIVIGKEMFRIGKFDNGQDLLDHYLK